MGCDASHHNSQCCGYSVPGENCGDRAADCFCYQWNCHGPLPQWEVLPNLNISTEVVASNSSEEPTEVASNSSEEPSRRLWVCPQGFVGRDQCDASHHNSQCCGYSVPGENCGDRAADCFCYQWNCHGPLPQWEVLPNLNVSTEVVASNSSEEPTEVEASIIHKE